MVLHWQVGSVWLYRTSDGRPQRLRYRHGYHISVTHMVWGNRANLLINILWCLISIHRTADGGFGEPIERMDVRGDIHHAVPISQLLLNRANNLLLVSTAESDAVWDLTRNARISMIRFGSRPQ